MFLLFPRLHDSLRQVSLLSEGERSTECFGNGFVPVIFQLIQDADCRCDGKTARFGSTCGNEKTAKATICDPELRTLNRKAVCGSKDDRYYFSPWRAPGSAPVFDACVSRCTTAAARSRSHHRLLLCEVISARSSGAHGDPSLWHSLD